MAGESEREAENGGNEQAAHHGEGPPVRVVRMVLGSGYQECESCATIAMRELAL